MSQPLFYIPPYDWANCGSADFFGGFGQYSFSTVEVGVILRNWCGITRAKFFRITPGE